MRSAGSRSAIALLLLGIAMGGATGYLVAQARTQKPASAVTDHWAELAQIRAELAELRMQTGPGSVDEQLDQLQAMVTDILLRGDEFSLRADFARTADRLEGHSAADFVLRDADGDGTDDLAKLRSAVNDMLSGATPVARAKRADSADNTEFLGNLPLTDFALANHTHVNLAGDVRMQNDVRVDGALAVAGNLAASGDVQVFGEVVAVGGLLPGAVNIDPKPAIAGMIRYNRASGALEYCDGNRWHEIAVVQAR